MFSFLLTLVIIYILWLVIRPLWYGMRQYRSFMSQAQRVRNAYSRATAGFGGGTGAQKKPKKKKIDRDTGEYVAFTEIEVTQSQTTTTATDADGSTFVAEEQVTDVKWTDLP